MQFHPIAALHMTPLLAFLALAAERTTGYPDAVFRFAGHPVIWIGRLIASLDRWLNRDEWTENARIAAGAIALAVVLLVSTTVAVALQALLGATAASFVVLVVVAGTLLAQRSLDEHVAGVATALETEGLAAGRAAVSRIVGRDPETLDEAGVSRAAIESLAENFSDGVVAPAFWIAVAGLPGGVAYKAINTADSMIGHRTPRHLAFGRAAARLDDLVNLPASRLSALLVIASAALMPRASAAGAWRAVRRDARKHRSPNAGWPEAAVAGALGLALAGPRIYAGVRVDDVFMGEGGRREASASDIRNALALYRLADTLLIVLAGLIAVLFWALG